jgi:hypothetical protein
MGNSLTESRYTKVFPARRAYGTVAIMVSSALAPAVNVQFSLLGPVRAQRGLDELDTGPRQQRTILALLLVRANQLVTVDDMIELLWEQDPPGSAANIIHKYIGAIRRLLEPGLAARATGRWLTRHGDAYQQRDFALILAGSSLVWAGLVPREPGPAAPARPGLPAVLE